MMTDTDKFFSNYLRSKTVFTNTFKNQARIRSLIKDYNSLTKEGTIALQDYFFEEGKETEINELIENRINLIDSLISAYESKTYSPVNDFYKEARKQGYFKDFSLEDLDNKLFEAGYKPNQDPNPPPTLETPTKPKIEVKSVTPRGKAEPNPKLLETLTKEGRKFLEERKPSLRGAGKITKEQKEPFEGKTKAQQEATARGEGAGMEDPAPVARPTEPLSMTEPDPTPVEVATGKIEPRENNDPIADLEPPTFSPDEMNPTAIDMEIERQAQLAASSMRQGQAPAPAPAPAPAQEPAIEETQPPKTEGQPIKETKVKTGLEDIPNKIDLIPKERLSADFKNESELRSDIEYFFKTFPNELKDIKKSYDSFPNKTLPYYQRIHRQIVARLQAGKGEKKKIGVIIEGEEFIKQKLKEVILEMRAEGLTNEDLLVNVEGDEETLRNDFGNYEVIVGESGKLHSQREPVYRYIPQTKKTEVPAEKLLEEKSKRARTQNLPTRFRSLYTNNAYRNQNNPFTKPTSQIKLKYLY